MNYLSIINLSRYALVPVAILALAVFFVFPEMASAAPSDQAVKVLEQCNSQSDVCKGTNEDTLFVLIRNIINLLLVVIGIIAVIMIIIGGIRYTTSAGDAGQTKMAKDTILYAIIGLVVAIMSYALVNWVLGNL